MIGKNIFLLHIGHTNYLYTPKMNSIMWFYHIYKRVVCNAKKRQCY